MRITWSRVLDGSYRGRIGRGGVVAFTIYPRIAPSPVSTHVLVTHLPGTAQEIYVSDVADGQRVAVGNLSLFLEAIK